MCTAKQDFFFGSRVFAAGVGYIKGTALSRSNLDQFYKRVTTSIILRKSWQPHYIIVMYLSWGVQSRIISGLFPKFRPNSFWMWFFLLKRPPEEFGLEAESSERTICFFFSFFFYLRSWELFSLDELRCSLDELRCCTHTFWGSPNNETKHPNA